MWNDRQLDQATFGTGTFGFIIKINLFMAGTFGQKTRNID